MHRAVAVFLPANALFSPMDMSPKVPQSGG